MAQGEFTKEGCTRVSEALDELFKGLPKSKQAHYLGHLNEICLFLEAAKRVAPAEPEPKKKASKK